MTPRACIMAVVGPVARRLVPLAAALLIVASSCGGSGPLGLAAFTAPPSASRVEAQSVDSLLLERTLPYTVYLPAGYDTEPKRRYPAIYLLHGMDGTHRQWLDLGAATAADDLMKSGEMPRAIIVMPEGERGYWMDQANDGPRWGSYVTDEVVRTIDARYRTIARRDGRAIGGLSMGGHGALQLAMNHPDEFVAVGAHSPALRGEYQAMPYFGRGREFAARDPMSLVTAQPDVARGFALWIDIGNGDRWAPGAEALHQRLEDLGIPHRWRETVGEHAASYWSAQLPDYLRFYGAALASAR
jgi:S-formylglutathione hydrolase FrmB